MHNKTKKNKNVCGKFSYFLGAKMFKIHGEKMLYLLQSEILDDNRIEFLMILYDSIYCLSLHRQHQRQNNEYIAQKEATSIFKTEI